MSPREGGPHSRQAGKKERHWAGRFKGTEKLQDLCQGTQLERYYLGVKNEVEAATAE